MGKILVDFVFIVIQWGNARLLRFNFEITMDKKKIIGGVLALIIVALGGYMIFSKKSTTAPVVETVKTVAKVNGVVITEKEYEDQLAASILALKNQGVDATASSTLSSLKTQVLNDMITNEIISQGVKAAGITVSQQEIDTQFNTIVTQVGGADKLAAELAKANLTEAKLKENISKQIAAQKFILANINQASTTVTDAEIKKFYDDAVKAQEEANKKLPKGQKPQPIPKLADVKAQIQQQLVLQKQQALATAFIQQLRAKAQVETTQ